MAPQNNYSDNIKYHWSQITITNIIMMNQSDIARITKIWHREKKWADEGLIVRKGWCDRKGVAQAASHGDERL